MQRLNANLLLLLLLAAAAAALRLAWLESTPLWWDEFVTLGRARLPLGDLWRSLAYQGPSDVSLDSSPPLLHLLVHAMLSLGGNSGPWAKVPSIVAGVLTLPVAYSLGARLSTQRAGLFAAGLLALSLHHITFSREARPYALFLLLGLASLLALLRALETNRARDWALHSLCLAASLYASYLGGPGAVAQAASLGVLLAWRRLPPGRLAPACLSLGAAALAYLPWLPGHLFHMKLIHSPGSDMGLTWGFLIRSLLEFTSNSPLLLVCAAVGLLSVQRRNPRDLALFLLWLAAPLAATLALRTGIPVNARYLMCFVPGLAILAGCGLEALLGALPAKQPRPLPVLLGMAAVLGLSWPGLEDLAGYYRKDSRSERDAMLAVARGAANAQVLAFARNRHQKVFARWYLPGLFGDLSSSGDLSYRRALLLGGPDFEPPGDGPLERFGTVPGRRVGILNLSPLPACGTYRAAFTSLDFHAQAAFWENMAPDLVQETLSLYDPERPGRALWGFRAPGGAFGGDARLTCRLRLTRSRATPAPDARAALVAGDSPETLRVLASVGAADFGEESELTLDAALPRPAGPELLAGIVLDPGTIHGSLDLMDFEARFDNGPCEPQGIAARLAGRARLAPWEPGVARAGEPVLTAFRPDDPLLPRFLEAHPGIRPVAQGPDLAVFDPALHDPWQEATGGHVRFEGSLHGFTVRGPWAGRTLRLGDTAVELPEQAPGEAQLDVGRDGAARLRARPDFASGEGGPAERARTVTVPEGPFLTCSGDDACFVTYAIRSRQPVRAVRVVHCPEVYGQPGAANHVRASLSTDGFAFRELDLFSARDSRRWEGKRRRVSWVRLEKPSELVLLRFELSGDMARLWSGPECPFLVDAWLQGPAWTSPAAQEGLLVLDAGPGVRAHLSPGPLPDLDGLLAPH